MPPREPPSDFDDAFLDWLVETLGSTPRPRGRVTDETIANAERRLHVRFPPDYALLMKAVCEPTRRTTVAAARSSRDRINLDFWFDPTLDPNVLVDGVYDGLAFDVENGLWLPEWGTRPYETSERLRVLRALVESAPRLLPVYGHRYLVGEPCAAGNPVLSVYQSDIIVYGADLRAYLLNEFHRSGNDPLVTDEQYRRALTIPFWGPILRGERWEPEHWDRE